MSVDDLRWTAGAWLMALLAVLGPLGQSAAAEPGGTYDRDLGLSMTCGDVFTNAVGPFDYTDPSDRAAQLAIVEKHHFNSDVESLERGISSSNLLDDIAFTLRVFPNHHRALNAVARYELEKGGIPPEGKVLSAECWFDRARRFKPDDGTVWLIYANLKARKNDVDEALEAYGRAQELMPDNPEVHYNLGLLYFKLGDYEKSRAHARVAYEGQYPLQGLRRRLGEKGYSPDE